MTLSSDLQRKLAIVVQTGLSLVNTRDLEKIVQSATDAGLALCGAQFGAFFYNIINEEGEHYRLYTLSGVDRENFSAFPMPRSTGIFAQTFEGRGIMRSADITKDPRYGRNAPFHGMPPGHLPVHSYLAVPVKAQSGEVLGGLFYGHEKTGVFDRDAEELVATVAAHAGIAIENARLREELMKKIEEQKKTEVRQKDASNRLGELAAIVESSDDVILSKDLTGRITSWNHAATRTLGYSEEEMVGASILRLIPEELHDDEKIILEKIRHGERIEHFETVRLTKGGERIDVSLSISPVRDASGEIIGASKILRDISTRKRMEISILQAEKIAATGRMAATIAHEINNPLEAVVNLLYLAGKKATDPEQIAYLTSAESEVTRVSHIARQTLGYYRENASAISTSLATLVADAARIYRPRCDSAGIRVELCIDSSKEIVVRRGEMMQVISNLIANSIYAMPSGGVLRLAVGDTPVGVLLTVEDNGTGISAEMLPRVFEAFFTTRKTIGTGIGLFVARQFVEGHGGKICVRSSIDPASHGTTISITLPLQSIYSAE
ncbi:PAS domain S-box protein [Paracidobacterium acidisoli]|uniref:histidine kinase n=1 Tax=Paracidobacterium acidisoli TaxID=2303751 RepID=A0A372INE1_9BACT|nr:PAS domain S-box protein [Paracidobacterium acidisoli]MBT9332075.1 PAS domain S-box protein [Paracidobacterium acidisoli]